MNYNINIETACETFAEIYKVKNPFDTVPEISKNQLKYVGEPAFPHLFFENGNLDDYEHKHLRHKLNNFFRGIYRQESYELNNVSKILISIPLINKKLKSIQEAHKKGVIASLEDKV